MRGKREGGRKKNEQEKLLKSFTLGHVKAVQGQHAFDEVIIMQNVNIIYESNGNFLITYSLVAQSCFTNRAQLQDRVKS